MNPKLKSGVSVIYKKCGGKSYEVNFLINRSDSVFPFKLGESAFKIVSNLNGRNDLQSLSKLANVSPADIESFLDLLMSKGLLEISMSADDFLLGDNPQINFLSSFATSKLSGQRMQQRITEASVLIIGLGGVGSWVLKSLALAGVSNFKLVDPDNVEVSNLNRQCLYAPGDVGLPKTQVAAQNIQKINPNVRCNEFRKKVDSPLDLKDIIDNVHLVINCADEPSTEKVNRIVTKTCYKSGIPHILCGGYDGHLGFVGPTIVPGKSPCWFCYEKSLDDSLKMADYKHLIVTDSDEKGGNISPISSVVGNIHALEALKLLSGFAQPTLLSKTIEIDFLRLNMHHRKFVKQKNCKFCSTK